MTDATRRAAEAWVRKYIGVDEDTALPDPRDVEPLIEVLDAARTAGYAAGVEAASHVPFAILNQQKYVRKSICQDMHADIEVGIRALAAPAPVADAGAGETNKETKMDPAKDEFAWVIERGDTPPSAPAYWTGGDNWSQEHLDAVRFSRRQDAEKVAYYFHRPNCRIAEHGWIAPPAKPAADE